MRLYLVFISLLSAVLFFSCEEQMVTIPEFSDECTDKVILIEELTGVSCPNCPQGTSVLEEILALYPDKVVAYSIHGNFLSTPLSNSKYNFQSEQGVEMEEFLEPWLGKPAATVDRLVFVDLLENGVTNSNFREWLTMVERRCQTPKSMDIEIDSEFDPENRTANITITTTGALPTEGQLLMNVVVTESHLIDPQDAGPDGIIEDYEHNHVMKERLSQVTGDFLINDLSVDQQVSKSYTYTLPDELNGEWKAENMEVIAFVTLGGELRGPVLHAAQAHLE